MSSPRGKLAKDDWLASLKASLWGFLAVGLLALENAFRGVAEDPTSNVTSKIVAGGLVFLAAAGLRWVRNTEGPAERQARYEWRKRLEAEGEVSRLREQLRKSEVGSRKSDSPLDH